MERHLGRIMLAITAVLVLLPRGLLTMRASAVMCRAAAQAVLVGTMHAHSHMLLLAVIRCDYDLLTRSLTVMLAFGIDSPLEFWVPLTVIVGINLIFFQWARSQPEGEFFSEYDERRKKKLFCDGRTLLQQCTYTFKGQQQAAAAVSM
eukprot:12947-Heterococcus_DN1.PRE.2